MFLLPGENIFLRTPEISDAEKIFHWENDPENKNVNLHAESLSMDEIASWLNSAYHDLFLENELRLMICNHEKDVLGCVDLFELDKTSRSAGVGILIDKNCRDCDFATEALFILKDYSFREIKLNSLWCNIFPLNIASIGLFEKCGFSLSESEPPAARKLHGYLFFQSFK